MRRREFLGVVAAGVLGGSKKASAFANCGPRPGNMGPIYTEELWAGLQRTLWVPWGPQDREATVYALVAPWCPFCTQLTNDALNGKLAYNVRAIPCEPRSFADRLRIFNVSTQPGRDTVADFHNRRPLQNTRVADTNFFNIVINLQQYTLWSVSSYIQSIYQATNSLGFPTLIIGDSEGAPYVMSGYGATVAPTIASKVWPKEVSARNVGVDTVARFASYRSERLDVVPKENASDVRFRVLPFDDALPTECANNSVYFKCDGEVVVDGDEWLVQSSSADGFKGVLSYARKSDFMQL